MIRRNIIALVVSAVLATTLLVGCSSTEQSDVLYTGIFATASGSSLKKLEKAVERLEKEGYEVCSDYIEVDGEYFQLMRTAGE